MRSSKGAVIVSISAKGVLVSTLVQWTCFRLEVETPRRQARVEHMRLTSAPQVNEDPRRHNLHRLRFWISVWQRSSESGVGDGWVSGSSSLSQP